MNENGIALDFETNIKMSIELEFQTISRYYVPSLRTFITTSTPGNPVPVFEEFKKRLDSLYNLSCHKKDLNEQKVNALKEWLNHRQNYSVRAVREGIERFEDYASELFKQNVIKIG